MANKILNYFRLFNPKSQPRENVAGSPPVGADAPGASPSIFWDIAHFFCLFLGIVSYPFVTAYQNGTLASFEISIPLIVFSFIVAVAIFPAVFKKSFDTTEPKSIQLCVTFASGIGYQSLFMTGETVVKNVIGG